MPMLGGGFSGVVSVGSSSSATYRCDFGALAYTVAGANHFLMIAGSASKTIKIVQYLIWKPSTNINLTIVKQSTITTGGTSSTGTAVPLDSSNAVATATVTLWTNATGQVAGTGVGTLLKINMTPGDAFDDEPGDNGGEPFVLRSAADNIVFASDASATLRGFIEWTES